MDHSQERGVRLRVGYIHVAYSQSLDRSIPYRPILFSFRLSLLFTISVDLISFTPTTHDSDHNGLSATNFPYLDTNTLGSPYFLSPLPLLNRSQPSYPHVFALSIWHNGGHRAINVPPLLHLLRHEKPALGRIFSHNNRTNRSGFLYPPGRSILRVQVSVRPVRPDLTLDNILQHPYETQTRIEV